MNKVEKIAAEGSRLFEGTIKMQDFRDNHFLGRTTNKWLFEATLKPHYKTFFSLTIILCNVIFASSSSSYGAGRHLCQEKESPQLDGWVVVGWDEVAISEFLLTTRCANSVNVVSTEIWGGTWRRIIVCRSDFGHSCENHKMEQASKGLKKHVKKYHSGEQDHCFRAFFLLKFFQRKSGAIFPAWKYNSLGKDTDISSHKHKTKCCQGIPSECQWTAIDVI